MWTIIFRKGAILAILVQIFLPTVLPHKEYHSRHLGLLSVYYFIFYSNLAKFNLTQFLVNKCCSDQLNARARH